MKAFSNLFIALAGSILLWIAWPTHVFTIFIFVSWLPLLWIEDHVRSRKKLFALTYLHMLIWNVLVTWWVWNASEVGAMGAFFANSLIMCLPWLLFRWTKRQFGRWIGYGSLIVFWLTFEFLHHNWELSWPWLTLGNAFAMHPEWVQWYEYSGTSGGSMWILLSNILAYALLKEYRNNKRTRFYKIITGAWFALLVMPIFISMLIQRHEKKVLSRTYPTADKNIVVVQPNVDPYTEKFNGDVAGQVNRLIALSESSIDAATRLVIWPETAIPAQVWEDQIKYDPYYQPVWAFLKRHPQVDLLTGIDSYKNYGSNKDNAPATSRYDSSLQAYYDAFNTAAFFNPDTLIELYHKAKLVPGVETLPSFLNFMGPWFEDFGGISGTLGRDSKRKVFITRDNSIKAAAVICYESIYSDYITEYIRNGANVLTIITNDGWWGNTPGYKQHMNYARLRAVETRKWVARSANTGISCFIDPLGNVINPLQWDVAGSIKSNIPVDNRMTFFVRHGDVLSRSVTWVCFLLLALNIFKWVRNKFMR